MSIVKKTVYPGWHTHPVFECFIKDWPKVSEWMNENQVENFTLSWGSGRVVFQVKSNEALFIMRWL